MHEFKYSFIFSLGTFILFFWLYFLFWYDNNLLIYLNIDIFWESEKESYIAIENRVLLSHKIALLKNAFISSNDVSLLQNKIFCAFGKISVLSINKYKIVCSIDSFSHIFK